MPEAVNVIGEKGGGKTLFAVYRACLVSELYPYCPVVNNIGIKVKGCYFVSDILRFIAAKIIVKDRSPMEFIIDEAALSGLESRDSHGLGSAIRSYLLALSRKTNSNIWLITQMMSMIEKRGQWLSDFDMLCEGHYESPASYELHIPDYFEYTVYNANRIKTNEMILWGQQVWDRGLFKLYDTNAVPNEDGLAAEFIQFFRIGEPDIREFCQIAGSNKQKMKQALQRFHSIKDALMPEDEEIEDLLGPFMDLLTFEVKDNIEYCFIKEGERMPKSKWGVIHQVLKEKGYHYVPVGNGVKGHWEKERENA